MSILHELEKAVTALVSPQNAARPPRQQTTAEGPQRAAQSGFRGATSNGTLDSLAQAEPLSAAAMRELRPKVLPKPEPDRLQGVPHPNGTQTQAIERYLIEEGFEPSAKVRAQLEALDAGWLRLQEAMSECVQNPSIAYHENLADIAARVAAGDTTVAEKDAWSRSDFVDDCRERLHAFKTQARAIEREAWSVAAPELNRKAEFAERLADELDAATVAPFAKFCIAWAPPPYAQLVRTFARGLRDGSRAGRGQPSRMLE